MKMKKNVRGWRVGGGGGAHLLSSCKSANGLSNNRLLMLIQSKKYTD